MLNRHYQIKPSMCNVYHTSSKSLLEKPTHKTYNLKILFHDFITILKKEYFENLESNECQLLYS